MNDPTAAPAAETTPDDPLSRGDAAAEREDWPSAVSAWQRALTSARRDDAIARLQWFIAWRTDRPIVQSRESRLPRKPLELFVGFLASCLFAVAAVFVTEDLSGAASDVFMVIAWLFIVAAAILALLYARYSDPGPAGGRRLAERQVRSLADRASKLAAPHSASLNHHH